MPEHGNCNPHTIASQKAIKKLKQARVCEQYAERVGIMQNRGMKEEYVELNSQAIKMIEEGADGEKECERQLVQHLNSDNEKQSRNTMRIPTLKISAQKYQEEYDALKKNGTEEAKRKGR